MLGIAVRRAVCVAVLIAGGLLACGTPERPVAQVDGKWVGQEQWEVFCLSRGLDPSAPEAERKASLNRLVRREVGAVLAVRRGLLSEEERGSQDAVLEALAARKAYVGDLVQKRGLPTEAELEAAFREEATARDLAVIPVRTPEAGQKARAALEAGEAFPAVKSKYGEPAASLPPDGRLPAMVPSQMSPALRKEILATAAGKPFGPVEAGQGFLVGVVEGENPPTHEAYLAAAPELRVTTRERIEDEEQQRVAQALANKHALKVNEPVLRLLTEGTAVPTDAEKAAAEVGGEAITLAAVAAAHQAASRQAGSALPRDLDTLRRLLDPLVDEARLTAEAKALGYHKSARAKALFWDMRQETLALQFVQNYLQTLAVPDATLQQYFREGGERFRVPDQLHLRALVGQSPAALERAVAAVRAGMPWKEALGAPGLLPQPNDGDLGVMSSQDLRQRLPGELVDQLVALEPGQWAKAQSGPGQYLALQLVDIQRGGVPDFAQVKDALKEAYLRENGQRLAFEYLDGPGRDGIDVKSFPENTAPAAPGK